MGISEEHRIFNQMLTESARPMEYGGTLPLSLKEFPIVKNKDGTSSNILTSQYEVDGKIWLLPTMRKGKKLSEEEISSMIKNNEHFGIYNSKAEADWMDTQIHEDFEKLHGE